jgi:hypothetical protein
MAFETEDFNWNRVIEGFVNEFETTFSTSKKVLTPRSLSVYFVIRICHVSLVGSL